MNNFDKIKSKIRNIPGFPKEGIIFRDITTLIQDPEGLKLVVDELANRYSGRDIDIIAGIEARGFTVGAALAYKLGMGFVLVRKAGKLPHETISHEYELEYGTDTIEIHTDAIKKGDRVLVIDDLLATGGTSIAAAKLVEKIGGEVVEMAFIVDLPDVGGRKAIADAGYSMFALCEFEGE
jgi:adenine phosphoribosyltransferase